MQGGFAHGPFRVALSFDYALNMNMLVGARLGYELFTDPASSNPGPGPAFAPFHLEARFTYLIGKDAIMQSFVPMLFAGLGAGEFDSFVPVQVFLNGPAGQAAPGPQEQHAWITAGPVFVKAGGGGRFAFGKKKRMALTVDLGLQGAFGGSAGFLFGFVPEAGVQLGF